jgi:hypothetical protein
MMSFLQDWWSWGAGVATPTLIGLGLVGAAIYVRLHVTTYLPLMGKYASNMLVVVGVYLVGQGQGFQSASEQHKDRALVAQAEQMKASIDELRSTIIVAQGLQDRVADFSKSQQEFASTQWGQTNGLIQQLQTIPVPPDCAYTPDVRKRLLNIHIRRPAQSGRTDPSR